MKTGKPKKCSKCGRYFRCGDCSWLNSHTMECDNMKAGERFADQTGHTDVACGEYKAHPVTIKPVGAVKGEGA